MTFYELLDQVLALLQRHGRVSYRALRVQFALDEDRLALLKEDPEYTHRDAAYYHLAEIYLKSDNKAQAIPYYQRLVDEFVQSEYLERAQKRLKELNAK